MNGLVLTLSDVLEFLHEAKGASAWTQRDHGLIKTVAITVLRPIVLKLTHEDVKKQNPSDISTAELKNSNHASE